METTDSAESEWYLPHFPFFNPHKPEKLRIVFDCAAKSMGVSLNDALSQGPDLMNSLVGVLTRFRKEPVALVANIKKMFHQVMLDPADRNYLKFLWCLKETYQGIQLPTEWLSIFLGQLYLPAVLRYV